MSWSSKTLHVAIIGYGVAGSVFHAPLIASTPGMMVGAIVTSAAERQEKARRDFPSAVIFSKPDDLWKHAAHYDLVVVASPNRTHVPLGIAAMEVGLPVVIDKPLAASVADAERLMGVSERTGKMLSVFQNRRWDNDFLTVQYLLNTELDLLGPIVRFESRYERWRPIPKIGVWREMGEPEEAGGVLYDLGSHLIDQVIVLFGEPTRVYAEVEKRRAEVLVDDDTFVALQFASGVRAHLWMNMVARILGPRIRLQGLRGTYEKYGLDPQEDALRKGMRPGDNGWGREPRESWGRLATEVGGVPLDSMIETLPGAYEEYYALLRDALLTGGKPPVEVSEVLWTLRVIEAAQESARSGRVVEL